MKVYISGPITGIENFEENFKKREKSLKFLGYSVLNPCEFNKPLEEYTRKTFGREPYWGEYMKICIDKLYECDGISLLPGWENSKGARIEKALADGLEKTIVEIYGAKKRFAT